MIRLKFLREEAGLSMQELGGRCSPVVAHSYISMAERSGFMYPSHLERIARVLEVEDPMSLLEEVKDENES